MADRVTKDAREVLLANDAPDEGVAVGMRPARGETEHHVARNDGPPVDDPVLLNDTDAESSEVVLALRIHAGHFGRFAADQGTAGHFATFGDALDDVRGDLLVELAASEIVEEEERLGALHQHVVHAHRDEVDADGAVAMEGEGELQLRAHAVGAGDKHGLLVFLRDFAKGAEAANAGEDLRADRFLGKRLDGLDQRIAGIDIDARIAVGQTVRHAKILRDATTPARDLAGGRAGVR